MSTYMYMRKAKTMTDYTMAKQFLLGTDEALAGRVERLATAIQETGGVRHTSEEVASKFIMFSGASGHMALVHRDSAISTEFDRTREQIITPCRCSVKCYISRTNRQ